MKMVIGGNSQGQLEWAKKNYRIKNWIDGRSCAFEDIYNCEGIYDFHQYIWRIMRESECDIKKLSEKMIRENPDMIVVSDEIGYGLVPVESFDRMYREQTGRICTELAAFSEEVTRVVMGINVRIKG